MLFFPRWTPDGLHLHRPSPLPSTPPPASYTPQAQNETTVADRRYRTDIPYLLPKDRAEENRLDFQHYALRRMLGADYIAPVRPDAAILDVGCGTGRWAIEMAKAFPQATVTGLDIERPVPQGKVPSSCQFCEGNLLRTLSFHDQCFDYVHQRCMVGAIPMRQWSFVLHELVRMTRAGGWIELVEGGDHYLSCGPAQQQLIDWWQAGSVRSGFDLAQIPHLDELLRQEGMQHVERRVIQVPLGCWGGRIGELMSINILSTFLAYEGFYTTRLGISAALFDALVDALQAEWELNRTSYEFYVFTAQKPASGAPGTLDEQPTLPMELGKQALKGQPRLYY